MVYFYFVYVLGVVTVVSLLYGCSSRPVKTLENLENTLISEREATYRYAAFSRQADDEGWTHVANLLEAMAHSEAIHVMRQQQLLMNYNVRIMTPPDTLVQVGQTIDNLAVSMKTEQFFARTAFPIFITSAEAEDARKISNCFEWNMRIAGRHANYCRNALETLEKDSSDRNIVSSWSVCPQCGCLYPTAALPSVCDICGEEGGQFDSFQ